MALTKIGSIGINTGIAFAGVTTIATLNGSDAVLSVGGTVNFVSDVSIGGTVSIAGTLTYEDVTNVDAVGLITARNGIVVGSGITLSKDGDIFATGVTTATTFSGSGASLTNLNASNLASGTVPSARLGSGTASSSTFLAGDSTFKTVTGTTINNNADNRVITGSGTANTLEGESGLTFSSNTLSINTNGSSIAENNVRFQSAGKAYIDHATTGQDIDIRTSVSSSLDTTGITIKSNGNLAFAAGKGIDFSAASNSASGSTSAVLDDYEEGTYNAFIMNGMDPDISSNTGAYSIQTGFYRKIGTYVEFNFFIRVTNNSAYESDGGQMRFNLPFTQDSTNYHKGHGIMSYTNINNPTPSSQAYHLYISGSQARMYSGQNEVSGGNGSGQNNRDFIGGGHFYTT